MRTLGVLMLIAMPLTAAAQTGSTPTAPPFTARGAFFALSVADIRASTRWYAEKFGLKPIMEEPAREGSPGSVAVLEGNGLIVELVQHRDGKALTVAAPGVTGPYMIHGPFKAGVIVDDFDGTVAALKARGVEIAHGPFPARGNIRANIIVRDNAGNLIQFFAAK
jgi:catechol 2,3-dioxygenase-like lactoylglutathione lyase family enzyme